MLHSKCTHALTLLLIVAAEAGGAEDALRAYQVESVRRRRLQTR